MSPARSKRTAIPHRRSRADIVRAASVATGIVVVTALLIWLMRPGPPGSLGTGGLMNRQPRSSAVVIGTLLLAGAVTWFVLVISRRARGHEKVVLPIALGVVLLAAVVVGFTWPGGLLRHEVAPPKLATTPTSQPTSTTRATGATGATGASSTTGATGSTGATGATSSSAPPTTGTVTTTSP
jgi:hypothetical protein